MLDVRKIRLTLELREAGISDSKVLSAIEKIPREIFVPENFRNQSYENIALPIGDDQTISQPYIVALMTQELHLKNTDKVLEIVSDNRDKSLEELLKYGIEEKREKLVQKLGENIVVRRVTASEDSADSSGVYLHSNNKIGTIISLKGGTEEVAKDIAMHAAATDPMAISPSDISQDVIDKEREIYVALLLDAIEEQNNRLKK